MGEWKSQRGTGSDIMADILGGALSKIGDMKWPTLLDLADALEFVSRGMLLVEIHPNAPKLGKPKSMSVSDFNNPNFSKTIPNRGQIHKSDNKNINNE